MTYTVTTGEAVEILRSGGVVLVPTETVVGLVAAEAGLHRLGELKLRDPDKPIAMLCATPEEAFAFAEGVSPLAERLAGLYWPGPLTLVLDRGNGGTIGLRVPDHATVQTLLASYGAPLHATSANLSGEPAPRTLEDVDPRIRDMVEAVVAGEPGDGEASAVVDLSGGGAKLLRATTSLTEDVLARLAGM